MQEQAQEQEQEQEQHQEQEQEQKARAGTQSQSGATARAGARASAGARQEQAQETQQEQVQKPAQEQEPAREREPAQEPEHDPSKATININMPLNVVGGTRIKLGGEGISLTSHPRRFWLAPSIRGRSNVTRPDPTTILMVGGTYQPTWLLLPIWHRLQGVLP